MPSHQTSVPHCESMEVSALLFQKSHGRMTTEACIQPGDPEQAHPVERCAAVGADVVQALDGALTVAEQHHLLPQDLHAHRLVLYLLRDACGSPQPSQEAHAHQGGQGHPVLAGLCPTWGAQTMLPSHDRHRLDSASSCGMEGCCSPAAYQKLRRYVLRPASSCMRCPISAVRGSIWPGRRPNRSLLSASAPVCSTHAAQQCLSFEATTRNYFATEMTYHALAFASAMARLLSALAGLEQG